MPIHWIPSDPMSSESRGQSQSQNIGRRSFLAHVGAAGGALVLGTFPTLAGTGSDYAGWALISDTHIHASDSEEYRGFNMARNLQKTVADVLKARVRHVLVNGDLARLVGNVDDYKRFASHTAPLRDRRIPMHLTLGNHDHRDHFLETVKGVKRYESVSGKYSGALLDSGYQWLFLDSLDKVNVTPGLLGDAQRTWIERQLDAHPHRPAVLFVHHNPENTGGGLQDTDALLKILRPRPQAKAVFFGHAHTWRRWEADGIHFVSLPAVGYTFSDKQPVGWVHAQPRDEGMQLVLRSLDGKHPQHGKKTFLAWRDPITLRRRV